jgi:hypothetical protein
MHGVVGNDQWRRPVQNLVPCATEGVKDGGVVGVGERSLTIRGEDVGGDAFLGR